MTPPHDLHAEEVMLSSGLWGDVPVHSTRLEPGDFFVDEHRKIWAVLLSLEEVLGDDVDWRTRVRAARAIVKLADWQLLAILRAAPHGRLAVDVERVRDLAVRRRSILALQRAEAGLRVVPEVAA